MENLCNITDIQRFSLHDGPGIRTTVFFLGCPMRCIWCHNPETQRVFPQIYLDSQRCVKCGGCVFECPGNCHSITEEENKHIFNSDKCIRCGKCADICGSGALSFCGKTVSVGYIMDIVLRDRAFYGKNGGITLSGGEPSLQYEAANALLLASRENDINTSIETCGYYLDKIDLSLCDHILFDIKAFSPKKHIEYTGKGNERILQNLKNASVKYADRITLRSVIIKDINDTEETVLNLKELALKHGIKKTELLKFHPYGSSKAENIGRAENNIFGSERVPTEEQLIKLKSLL